MEFIKLTPAFMLMSLFLGCARPAPVEEIQVANEVSKVSLEEYVADANDWPGWRGPNHDGSTLSSPPPKEWSEVENVVWKTAVPGRGHASPVVRANLVILSTAIEELQQQLLIAYYRKTGEEAWRVILHEKGFPTDGEMHLKSTNANGTVACDQEHAYIAYLNDNAIVASAVDFKGKIVWQTKLGPFNSKFGYAPSPILFGPYVIFAADNSGGGYLAAVNRKTGEIAWRKHRSNVSTYSSPVVANMAGKDQLLISGGDEISSYDPSTGEKIWSCPGASEATCGTVVWKGDTVFCSGGYPGQQTLAVKADGSSEILWSNKTKIYEPSMLVVGDELYATSDKGIVYCWNANTGNMNWKKRVGGSFSASPIFCDGCIYALNSSGEMIVFKATAEGYQELARNQLGDDGYASPALCNGSLYLRIGEGEGRDRQEHLYRIASQFRDETKVIDP